VNVSTEFFSGEKLYFLRGKFSPGKKFSAGDFQAGIDSCCQSLDWWCCFYQGEHNHYHQTRVPELGWGTGYCKQAFVLLICSLKFFSGENFGLEKFFRRKFSAFFL
jgi:hypothetical protein